MRKNQLWLLILLLIAFALRLISLGEQSLWYDEGVTWFLSQRSTPLELIRWTAADIQPPLYYLLLWLTGPLFGQTEWALRFPSVIFNLLTLPLIYLLARQLFAPRPRYRSVGSHLAAILFALSPLMVYYSQEARMYSLLVLEATLTGYLLLKLLHPGKVTPIGRTLPLFYSLSAAAALYTHYFALLLLAAHALYTAFILRQRHWPGDLIRRMGQMFGLTVLLFSPWLPILLSRLGDDPSYWPGALKLNEAIRKVFISFAVGETVFEQTGFGLSLGYLGLLLLAGLWVAARSKLRQSKESPVGQKKITAGKIVSPPALSLYHSFLFLFLWLLLPILLILLLSYQSPKFNPRYTLLAWPAFNLILAAALAGFLDTGRQGAGRGRYVSPGLFSLALLFILTTFGYSLFNWFADPRFSKDDFQALAQFVQERSAGDETVLLSSGHLFPVWAYYYGWENWTPLPEMARLDTNRVTDLSIAADIAAAVAGKAGVWLVTWQDEVIDPNGVVPFWLDLIGRRPADAGDFYGVGLEHWRLNPQKIELLYQSPIKQPADFNFANQVTLAGMTQLSDTEIALFWRPQQPLPDDLVLTLDLTDQKGFDWDSGSIVGQPGSLFYPPSRWPAGRLILTRHPLLWKTGTPPGFYLAEIGLGQSGPATFTGWDLLDRQGRPQRRTALPESIRLSDLVRPAGAPLPPAKTPVVDLLPLLSVRSSALSEKSAEPGDRLLLNLMWQAGEHNQDDVSVAFDVVDANGQRFRAGSAPTPSRNFNLPLWKPGDVVLGQYWLTIPAEIPAGPAGLQLQVINAGSNPYNKIFLIDHLDILPTNRIFSLPAAVDIPLEADFSGRISLIGVNCAPPSTAGAAPATSSGAASFCRAAPGESVTLTLYWRAEASINKNYTIFTHLLGSNETLLLNADHAPPKPTRGWIPAEIIADTVTLTIPADFPPGDYDLEVGLYDATDPSFPRLPLTTGETRVILPQPLTVK